MKDLFDGTAHIIMVVETIDDLNSEWIAGSDATLAGLPKIEMSQPNNGSFPFWHPTGYNGKYYEDASPKIQVLRTYLSYDFDPNGKDAGRYPKSIGRTPKYGPSAVHPQIVNHLYGDGAVRCIRKDIDYARYFFYITRSNGDPAPNYSDNYHDSY